MNRLTENLLHLAAQAASGVYDERELRDRIMHLWRGMSFQGVPGQRLVLVPTTEPTMEASAEPTVEAVQAAAPSLGPVVVVCSGRRRHAVLARRGEACPLCGWYRPPREDAAEDPHEEST